MAKSSQVLSRRTARFPFGWRSSASRAKRLKTSYSFACFRAREKAARWASGTLVPSFLGGSRRSKSMPTRRRRCASSEHRRRLLSRFNARRCCCCCCPGCHGGSRSSGGHSATSRLRTTPRAAELRDQGFLGRRFVAKSTALLTASRRRA